MILEAVQFAASWVVSRRRIGSEIRSSVSLWARARRCRNAWASHEAHCHAAIADAVERLGQHRSVVVLGSGLLRDVPVDVLSDRFDHVVLVDLQHLATIRAWVRWRGLGNVSFIQADVSGSDEPGTDPLSFVDLIDNVDLIISANLASQIAVGIRNQYRSAPGGLAQTLATSQVTAHLAALASRPCPALLLTDTRYVIRARDGVILESDDLLAGSDPGTPDQQWDWQLAPFGEIDRSFEIIHHAMARFITPQRAPSDVPPPSP